MSHSEVWDDSLLVNSWNEALEEYKYYHSIQAKGEKIEDVLKEAEKGTNGAGGGVAYEKVDVQVSDDQNAAKSLPVETPTSNHDSIPPEGGAQVENSHLPVSEQASESMGSKAPVLPQHLIGQVHDESLKNLLMSWYYAGYYTGLYEGQRQGAASKDA